MSRAGMKDLHRLLIMSSGPAPHGFSFNHLYTPVRSLTFFLLKILFVYMYQCTCVYICVCVCIGVHVLGGQKSRLGSFLILLLNLELTDSVWLDCWLAASSRHPLVPTSLTLGIQRRGCHYTQLLCGLGIWALILTLSVSADWVTAPASCVFHYD